MCTIYWFIYIIFVSIRCLCGYFMCFSAADLSKWWSPEVIITCAISIAILFTFQTYISFCVEMCGFYDILVIIMWKNSQILIFLSSNHHNSFKNGLFLTGKRCVCLENIVLSFSHLICKSKIVSKCKNVSPLLSSHQLVIS